MFEEGAAIGWLTSILRREIFSHGRYGDHSKPESERLLSAHEFSFALDVMLSRYRNTPPEVLMEAPELMSVLFAWLQGGAGNEARAWVQTQTATDVGLIQFLSRTRGWGAVNGVPYYPIRRHEVG